MTKLLCVILIFLHLSLSSQDLCKFQRDLDQLYTDSKSYFYTETTVEGLEDKLLAVAEKAQDIKYELNSLERESKTGSVVRKQLLTFIDMTDELMKLKRLDIASFDCLNDVHQLLNSFGATNTTRKENDNVVVCFTTVGNFDLNYVYAKYKTSQDVIIHYQNKKKVHKLPDGQLLYSKRESNFPLWCTVRFLGVESDKNRLIITKISIKNINSNESSCNSLTAEYPNEFPRN